MIRNRRTFLRDSLAAGGLSGLLLKLDQGSAEGLMAALDVQGATGEHDSRTFWDTFGEAADTGPSGAMPRGRGLLKSSAGPAAPADLSRQIDFFHYGKDKTLRFATSIGADELLDHEGDVVASVNVNGFRMAGDDRDTFAKLQSAQLRIDVVQGRPLMQYLDPLAWMSLAALFPGKGGKLPPLQNLSFDPASTYRSTQQIILPGGSAQIAVNVSMAHKDSTLVAVMKTLTTEVERFSPVLGLPAISVTALKGFCSLYGAMEQKTTFLLNSLPLRAFATQKGREEAQTQQGINMVAGDYVLVPHAFTEQLTPYLDSLELRQGYLVPKGTSTNTSVYDVATALKPDVTYVSATIGIKPAQPPGAPATPAASPEGTSTDTPNVHKGASGGSTKPNPGKKGGG